MSIATASRWLNLAKLEAFRGEFALRYPRLNFIFNAQNTFLLCDFQMWIRLRV